MENKMRYFKKNENEHYRFLDTVDTKSSTPIELLEDPYRGIVIAFGKVSLLKDDTLSYNFDIVNEDVISRQSLMNDVYFKNYVHQILTSILIDDIGE